MHPAAYRGISVCKWARSTNTLWAQPPSPVSVDSIVIKFPGAGYFSIIFTKSTSQFPAEMMPFLIMDDLEFIKMTYHFFDMSF